jgi:putative drug exporter of the RND superfamily
VDIRSRLAGIPAGRVTKWLVVVVWLLVAGALGPLSGKLTDAQKNDGSAWLPHSAESTRAAEELERFDEKDVVPTVVLYTRDSGITAADRAKADADRQRLLEIAKDHRIGEVVPSDDGKALLLTVPLVGGEDAEAFTDQVTQLREVVGADPPDGLQVKVTGPGGQLGDLLDAFAGLDVTVLMVSVAVVAVVLLLTYRSPVLWLVPLLVVGVASVLANAVVYLLAAHAGLVVNGQSASILTVLVFGAGTDYALLLVARYREELHRHGDRHVAMAVALRRSVPAILASSATVVIGLLCLLAAELNSNRGLGPVGAVGVACAFLTMTTLLPALLVVLGRWVFWPFVPRFGTPTNEDRTVWSRVGRGVGRRPRTVWVGTAVVLGAVALAGTGMPTGLTTAGMFRDPPESVVGQQMLAAHYPAGQSTPVEVLADASAEQQVRAAVTATSGVADVLPSQREGDRVRLPVVLTAAPDTTAAERTVKDLREAVHGVDGADALVGGMTAMTVDTNEAISHDKRMVIPLVLLTVFVVLALLLRALVAPMLLIATVVLSFLTALGASTLLFDHVFGFEALDQSLVLSSFIFLVALGIDYNIFLMTRVREEAIRIGHGPGVLRALAVTGGVITSAGLVLAATFSVLATLPLVGLAETGVLVGLGVLLDTFVVRSVLVPALALDTGRAIWWPGRLARRGGTAPAANADADARRPGAGEAADTDPVEAGTH